MKNDVYFSQRTNDSFITMKINGHSDAVEHVHHFVLFLKACGFCEESILNALETVEEQNRHSEE
jgi:hypothetical protein